MNFIYYIIINKYNKFYFMIIKFNKTLLILNSGIGDWGLGDRKSVV